MEALKAMLTDLRLSVAAKDAELVIIKAEGESFRRQLIPRAQNTLSADTEVTLRRYMQPHQTWHETAHKFSLCWWPALRSSYMPKELRYWKAQMLQVL